MGFGIKSRVQRSLKRFLHRKYKYIIRRSDTKVGLFSVFITNLGVLHELNEYARYIQIADIPGVEWNSFFELREAKIFGKESCDSTRVIDGIPEFRPDDSMGMLTNHELVNYWHFFYTSHLTFTDKVKQHIERTHDSFLRDKDNCTIGVLCRGTDYKMLEPKGHPRQPEPEQLFVQIDRLLGEKYKYVYLVTEDIDILSKFEIKYGQKLISLPQNRIEVQEPQFLADLVEEKNIDTYSRNLDYLTSVVLLSRCSALVAGRTSATVAAMVMSDGFDDVYLYDDGRYGDGLKKSAEVANDKCR